MEILIITAFVSAAGIMIILFRHLSYVRNISQEQLLSRINTTKSFRKSLYGIIVTSSINRWNNYGRKWFYGFIEKIIGKFRVIILKIEKLLLRFSNYIHGKHEIKKNGNHSEYWQNITKFKNGLNDDNADNIDKPA